MRTKQEIVRRINLMVSKFSDTDCDGGKFMNLPNDLITVWDNLVSAFEAMEVTETLTKAPK